MAIRAIVEERIKELFEQSEPASRGPAFPTVTTSLRMPEDLRFKLDLLAWYLGTSRQALLMTILQDAVSEGLQAFRDVSFRQGGDGCDERMFSVDDALEEGLKALREGKSPEFLNRHFEYFGDVDQEVS